MSLFSEIYGAYFGTVEEILRHEVLTEEQIYEIISGKAFRDSALFISEKLIPDKDGNSPWGLLRREGKLLRPIIKNPPPKVMTMLQRRWLMSVISDKKAGLFMDNDNIAALKEKLGNVPPLYDEGFFCRYDLYTDGDDYSDRIYIEAFRNIIKALKNGETLLIRYARTNDEATVSEYIPLRLEYSPKNDRIRLRCLRLKKGKIQTACMLNIMRMLEAKSTGNTFSKNIRAENYDKHLRCDEPALLEISAERNGIERFMMEFASYEKHTVMDTKRRRCTVELYYPTDDETELLVRLLAFGPIIEIKGPEHLRSKAAERIKMQYELLNNNERNV